MLTFEDTVGFERSAGVAAAAAGAAGLGLGALAGPALFAPGGPLWAGWSGAAGAVAERLAPWVGLACAAAAVSMGAQRRRRAREAGEPLPSRGLLAVAGLLAALGGIFAARALPALAALLVQLLAALPIAALLPLAARAALACAACGAALGLWVAACSVPVHLARLATEVDRRLVGLRFRLGPELRPLAERAAQAHRGALAELRARGAAGALPIRATLDQLALAALDLAARAADLARAAPPAQADQAGRRRAELLRLAAAAQDPSARARFERAADAQEQLAGRMRALAAGRERLFARLHEEVGELEQARAALALLSGAAAEQAAAEIDLLDERLRAAASAAEAIADLAAATPAHPARAGSLAPISRESDRILPVEENTRTPVR